MVQVKKTLRELHREHRPLVSPLAHDALSARLIERAGFKTFNIGGSAMLAARYALPDLGLAGFAEMLAGIRDIVGASTLPCLVDADDGYGDVKSVIRTIQGYETAGVSGALLEDQSREAKQPGAAPARSVVPLEIMEQKLKAAMEARRNPDFVIIGRTDAYGAEGLDAAIERAERFLHLGADGIFVAGLKTPEDYVRVGKAFKGTWNCAAIFEVAATPWLTPADLFDMGFSQVAFPNILIGRVAKAVEQGLHRLSQLAAGKDSAFKNGEQEMALQSLVEAIDLKKWNALEKKYR
jgi:2-methylisocitrate lyase-like PEP mutase family enzyme